MIDNVQNTIRIRRRRTRKSVQHLVAPKKSCHNDNRKTSCSRSSRIIPSVLVFQRRGSHIVVYMSGFPSSYSPKSSPRGARSPVVSRQDSTGTLKTTISLGKNPSIVHSGPFYLMKEPPCKSTGARVTDVRPRFVVSRSRTDVSFCSFISRFVFHVHHPNGNM